MNEEETKAYVNYLEETGKKDTDENYQEFKHSLN